MQKYTTLLVQLKQYLQSLEPALFGVTAISTVTLERLETGLHNVNYLVTLNNSLEHRFILRFHPNNDNGKDKAAAEASNMHLLEGMPIPKLLWTDKPDFLDSTIIIIEFIPGVHKDFNTLTVSEIKALAATLAEVHSKKSKLYSPSWSAAPTELGDYADYFKSVVKSTITTPLRKAPGDIYSDSAKIIHEAVVRLDVRLVDFDNKEFSLLHTDIGSGNVLWNNSKPTFIDWEEVTFGDPADEVAYVFAINNLSKTHQSTFLKEYLAHCDDVTLGTRLPLYMLKNRLFDLVWSIGKLSQQASGIESELMSIPNNTYKKFYDERRDALERCLHDS